MRLTAQPAGAAARAPPRGKDFDFKERKEGKTTPSFPVPPSPLRRPGQAMLRKAATAQQKGLSWQHRGEEHGL